MGYHRAFPDAEIVGHDIVAQPRYPFTFMQSDAMAVLDNEAWLQTFDLIHASPPCQAYSITKHSHDKTYPDYVAAVRRQLVASGVSWVIENVVGAPMPSAVELCGAAFGLTATDDDGAPLVLRRHRRFEASWLVMPPPCDCKRYKALGYMVGGVYGGGPSNRSKAPWKGSHRRRGGYTPPQHVRRELMGIDWMVGRELCEAIPPAYTQYIGTQLAALLEAA
jgi:DNA (cytosine-5)-methyltransferase 1